MSTQMRVMVAVGSGAALGSVVRYLVSAGLLHIAGPEFPWGTLAVNVFGSFLIGLYFALTEPGGRWRVGPASRQFVLAGFCGGLTTFSIFSLEALQMVQAGDHAAAAGLVASSALLWLLAVWAGHRCGGRINGRTRAN